MTGRRGDHRRTDRGATQLHAAWLVLAAVALAGLICLALLSWFGRVS